MREKVNRKRFLVSTKKADCRSPHQDKEAFSLTLPTARNSRENSMQNVMTSRISFQSPKSC